MTLIVLNENISCYVKSYIHSFKPLWNGNRETNTMCFYREFWVMGSGDCASLHLRFKQTWAIKQYTYWQKCIKVRPKTFFVVKMICAKRIQIVFNEQIYKQLITYVLNVNWHCYGNFFVMLYCIQEYNPWNRKKFIVWIELSHNLKCDKSWNQNCELFCFRIKFNHAYKKLSRNAIKSIMLEASWNDDILTK